MSRKLLQFGFFVWRVFTAPLTEFFQFELGLDLFLVARAVIIDALADRALETDEKILGHNENLELRIWNRELEWLGESQRSDSNR